MAAGDVACFEWKPSGLTWEEAVAEAAEALQTDADSDPLLCKPPRLRFGALPGLRRVIDLVAQEIGEHARAPKAEARSFAALGACCMHAYVAAPADEWGSPSVPSTQTFSISRALAAAAAAAASAELQESDEPLAGSGALCCAHAMQGLHAALRLGRSTGLTPGEAAGAVAAVVRAAVRMLPAGGPAPVSAALWRCALTAACRVAAIVVSERSTVPLSLAADPGVAAFAGLAARGCPHDLPLVGRCGAVAAAAGLWCFSPSAAQAAAVRESARDVAADAATALREIGDDALDEDLAEAIDAALFACDESGADPGLLGCLSPPPCPPAPAPRSPGAGSALQLVMNCGDLGEADPLLRYSDLLTGGQANLRLVIDCGGTQPRSPLRRHADVLAGGCNPLATDLLADLEQWADKLCGGDAGDSGGLLPFTAPAAALAHPVCRGGLATLLAALGGDPSGPARLSPDGCVSVGALLRLPPRAQFPSDTARLADYVAADSRLTLTLTRELVGAAEADEATPCAAVAEAVSGLPSLVAQLRHAVCLLAAEGWTEPDGADTPSPASSPAPEQVQQQQQVSESPGRLPPAPPADAVPDLQPPPARPQADGLTRALALTLDAGGCPLLAWLSRAACDAMERELPVPAALAAALAARHRAGEGRQAAGAGGAEESGSTVVAQAQLARQPQQQKSLQQPQPQQQQQKHQQQQQSPPQQQQQLQQIPQQQQERRRVPRRLQQQSPRVQATNAPLKQQHPAAQQTLLMRLVCAANHSAPHLITALSVSMHHAGLALLRLSLPPNGRLAQQLDSPQSGLGLLYRSMLRASPSNKAGRAPHAHTRLDPSAGAGDGKRGRSQTCAPAAQRPGQGRGASDQRARRARGQTNAPDAAPAQKLRTASPTPPASRQRSSADRSAPPRSPLKRAVTEGCGASSGVVEQPAGAGRAGAEPAPRPQVAPTQLPHATAAPAARPVTSPQAAAHSGVGARPAAGEQRGEQRGELPPLLRAPRVCAHDSNSSPPTSPPRGMDPLHFMLVQESRRLRGSSKLVRQMREAVAESYEEAMRRLIGQHHDAFRAQLLSQGGTGNELEEAECRRLRQLPPIPYKHENTLCGVPYRATYERPWLMPDRTCSMRRHRMLAPPDHFPDGDPIDFVQKMIWRASGHHQKFSHPAPQQPLQGPPQPSAVPSLPAISTATAADPAPQSGAHQGGLPTTPPASPVTEASAVTPVREAPAVPRFPREASPRNRASAVPPDGGGWEDRVRDRREQERARRELRRSLASNAVELGWRQEQRQRERQIHQDEQRRDRERTQSIARPPELRNRHGRIQPPYFVSLPPHSKAPGLGALRVLPEPGTALDWRRKRESERTCSLEAFIAEEVDRARVGAMNGGARPERRRGASKGSL
eukprot:TRINITY_DN1643_c0_g2_i1.p1 TRINITY_DN1643_c0_g2~~TRINITY_DN1643_c0_g2_i1.p1  ORF type:complete len:1416 (+),score=238.14 TRINITY_DN1643_c0_g2_i1:79-4248(+)